MAIAPNNNPALDRASAGAARPDQPGWACETVRLIGSEGEAVDGDVRRIGAGPGFVFLHGLVGLNEHWDEVVHDIRHRARCTTLELPLLDLTGATCSVQGVTELTIEFLETHVEGPSVLVGNSFGGHVALRVARRRPDLVRALVLAGSSGLIEKTFVRGAPVRPSRAWVTEKIGELFHDRSKMSEGDIDRAHAALSKRTGARAMVRLSKTARRDHMGDDIAQIRCPVLLVWGREDIVTPPSAAQGFMDLLPDPRITWLDDCGHAPMLECPHEFAQSVLKFIGELEDGTGPG